ncbi:MAG: tandem-95 repeat protein, partial [Candidatus Cloacimonetes bacterium]|nr:tandem-95 repeat protein [Candidatus Cloacimonadota bacterium]
MRHFLIISMILLFSAGVLMAETPNWTPITGNQYNMVVFSVVQLNEEDFSNESGNLLGAFGPGGESDCRAIAGYFAGPGVWNMTIGSNVMSGEEISFKIYASEYDTVLDCEETLEFINDATVGSPEEPFELQVEFVFNHPPVIDLPAELTITEDEADQVDFSSYVFDPDGDDLILTCSATMNIDVSISYMIVAFTPAADWNGSETLTFTVYDTESGRLSASDEMMVTVTPVNDPPVIDLPSELIFNEDESLTLEASEYFYDVDGDVLNIAGFGENVSVTVIDGSLIFTAVENWNGTEPVAFFVDDGVSRIITMGEVTVTVTAVNDEPVLLGYDPEWDTSEIIESGTIDFSVTVEDIDSEIEYNWQVNEVGAGNTAEMTYAFDEIGSYMITAGWSDGEFDGSHFWELEVIPDPGEFPRPWDIVYYTNSTVAYCDVTIDGIAAAAEDEVGAFVNGECRGIGYIVLESGAAVSTMNIQGEIPELVEFAVWKASEDMVYVSEFTAMSNPGGDIGYPPDLLPIAVITNYPPVLNLPDELSLDEDTSTTFDFGGYVSDPDGDDLVLTCAHDENLQIDIDGLMVTVTPFANWFGPNTVTFMLSDEQGRLVTEDTMIFMVNPVNDPPFLVAPPTNISFNEDRNKILEFVSGDIEGSAVTITASAGENLMVNQLSPVILVLHSAVSNWYGTSTLNIHLTDEEGGFSDIEIPVTVQPVNDCPTAPSVLPLTTEYNQPLTINLDEYYSDPDGDDLIYTVNSQDHLNFSISNNEALITPAPDYSGVALGSLRGTDPAGLFKLMHIILQIPEPDFPPELHGINPSYTLSEDASKVVTLYAIDDHTPVDELDFEITVMPVHGVAAINPSTRKLTYSPYSNYYGTDQLQIVVTDSGGNVSEAGQYNFVIIRAVNEPPTGQNVEIQLTGDTLFYDLSGDIFDVETPVESLVISSCFNNNDGIPLSLGSVEFTITGTQISYVMPVEENTDYIFYRVTDEDNSSSIPNAIHIVRAGNLPAGERLDPMALNGSFNLEYGQSYEIDFNGLDITEPLEQLTIEIMTAPQYGELTDFGFYEFNAPITTWMGTYTPLTNQDITDEIGFRVSGNNGEAFGTVTINVTAVEIAPDIEEIADFSMLEETSETITINYQNPDEALNPDFWSLSSSPNINSMLSFGELTETTIELIISPAADYTGMALVFVTCTDGSGLSDTEGFVLTVVNVNDAPVINLPDEFSFPEDEEFETSFYGYVSDIDGDALSLNANAADHLQIGIDGMQVTFVPDADWNGTETVTFTVNDNQGRAVASDDVDIVVTAVNDDPSITLPASVTLQEDIAEIIDFTPYLNDIDGDILTITPYGNEYIALDVNGYDVTLTPAADWFGTTDLAFLVDDNQGGNQAFGAMQVIVNAVNDAPEIDLPDNFSFMEDADLTVDFTGFLSDPDSDLLTLSVSGNTEIIVTITDYSVHFSAGADYYGSEILTFNVDDNQGRLIASDQVEVVVTPVNDEPVISGFIPEELDIVIDVETEINFSVAASDVDSEIAYQWFLNSIDLSNPQNYLTLDFTSPGINVIIVNVSDEEYTVSVTWQITFEQPENYDRPWVPVIYTNSTVAYCEVMINGEPAAEDDEVGAFVNYECRGVGYIIQNSGSSYSTMNIQGSTPELVNFAIYDASMDAVLVSEFTTMSSPGGDIGYPPDYLPVYIGELPPVNYARPWVPFIYTNSTVAYCEVMINGEMATEDDEVGAFVDFECRGVGSVVVQRTGSYATLNIQGETPELVNFAVYDASMDEVLISEFTTISNPGGDIGYPPDYLEVYIGEIPQVDYARPWIPVYYTNSTVAYCEVTIDDGAAAADDEVGAFINGECRGIGYIVLDSGTSVSTMNIQGDTPELVEFAVWIASEDMVYVSEFTTMSNPGGDIGYPPDLLPINVITNNPPVLDLPAELVLDEDTAETFDFSGYLSDPDGDDLVLSCVHDGNLQIDIEGFSVTVTPLTNWNGSELVTFQLSDVQDRLIAEDEVLFIVNAVNDLPYLVSPLAISFSEDTYWYQEMTFGDVEGSVVSMTFTAGENLIVTQMTSRVIQLRNAVTNWNGSDTLWVYLTDADGGMTDVTVPVTVLPVNDLPVVSTINLEVEMNQEIVVDLNEYCYDPDGDVLSYAVVTGMLNNLDISIAGSEATLTPFTNYSGLANGYIRAIDPAGLNRRFAVNLEVTAPNYPPEQIITASLFTLKEDTQKIVQLYATDDSTPINQLIFQISAAPAHGVAAINPSTRELTYTPVENYFGTDQLQVIVTDTDGAASAAGIYNFAINAVNDRPVSQNQEILIEGDIFDYDISGDIFDLETPDESLLYLPTITGTGGEPLTVFGLEYTQTGMQLYYEMPAGLNFDYIVYRVVDEGGSQSLPVAIRVYREGFGTGGVRLDPLAINGSFNLDFGQGYEIDFNGLDITEPLEQLTIEITTAPQYGELTGFGFYAFNAPITTWLGTYTPSLNEDITDEIGFRVFGDDGEAFGTITINITAVEIAPDIEEIADYSMLEDTSETITISYQNPDEAVNLDFWSLSSNPNINGMLSFGELTATSIELIINPEADYTGMALVFVTCTDGSGLSDMEGFVLTVVNVNDAPVINLPDELSFPEDEEYETVFYGYVSDIDGDALSLSANAAGHLQIEIDGLLVTFIPDADWNGVETVTFTVNDNQGRAVASDEVDIVVTAVNDDPSIALPASFTMQEDMAEMIDFTPYLTDIDGDILTILPFYNEYIAIDINGYEVTLTPAADWFGTTDLAFLVADNQGGNPAFGAMQVIVNAVNDSPEINLPVSFSFMEDGDLTVDFTTFVSDPDADVLTLSVSGNSNIIADITGYSVHFSALADYYGSEILTFSVDDNQGRLIATDQVEVIVTAVNDEPVISGFAPEDQDMLIDTATEINFSVLASDIDSEIDFQWFLNSVDQNNPYDNLTLNFTMPGIYEIMVNVSDEEYTESITWQVTFSELEDYARPWVPVIYTNSTVAYCEVKINDVPAAIEDEVGAFINYECRGVGNIVTDGMNSYATMNIQGNTPELINFAVYDASMDVVLISEFTAMSNPGGDIGYPPDYLPVYIGEIPHVNYARPWVPVVYTNSTVAYCEVMINGEMATEDDEVGAFVDFECRGVGNVVVQRTGSYATMNIQGESPELVNFAVYDASMDEVLISEFTTMSNPGGDIGYPPDYLTVYIGTIPQGDYARPWVPVIYTNSTVAYCEVMINGEMATEDDEVGAFVDFECRGVGNVVVQRTGSYATMNIQGESPELVNFAVYDASMDEVLISEFTTMSNPGGDIGYPPDYLTVYIGTIPQGDYARPWVPVI